MNSKPNEDDYLVPDKDEMLILKDIITEVSHITGFNKKDTGIFVRGFIQFLKTAIEQKKTVLINGIGVFRIKHIRPKTIRDPKSGIFKTYEAWDAPKFTFSVYFRNNMAKKEKKRIEEIESYDDHVQRVLRNARLDDTGSKREG